MWFWGEVFTGKKVGSEPQGNCCRAKQGSEFKFKKQWVKGENKNRCSARKVMRYKRGDVVDKLYKTKRRIIFTTCPRCPPVYAHSAPAT